MSVTEPEDRASLDAILRFLMAQGEPQMVLGGRYRLVDLIGDLGAIGAVCEAMERGESVH